MTSLTKTEADQNGQDAGPSLSHLHFCERAAVRPLGSPFHALKWTVTVEANTSHEIVSECRSSFARLISLSKKCAANLQVNKPPTVSRPRLASATPTWCESIFELQLVPQIQSHLFGSRRRSEPPFDCPVEFRDRNVFQKPSVTLWGFSHV